MVSVHNPTPHPRTLRSIVVSIVFLAIGVGVYVFFVRTAMGQLLDASSFGAVVWLREPDGNWTGRVRTVLLVASGAIFVLLLIIALARRRVRDSAIAMGMCVVALLLSGGLKQFVVVRPDLGNFGYSYNTFPSGHETITVAALVGAYLLLPDRARRPAMVLPFAVLATASGAFQVIAYAHRPSDVIAATLLVGAVAAWIPWRGPGIGAAWRGVLWGLVAVAGIAGALCLYEWQANHYPGGLDVVTTFGIALCTAAGAGAALIVGAERATGARVVARSIPVPELQATQ